MNLLQTLREVVQQAQVARGPLWSLYLDLSGDPEGALRFAAEAARAVVRAPGVDVGLRGAVLEAVGALPGAVARAEGARAPSVALFVGDGLRIAPVLLPFAVSSRSQVGEAPVVGPLLGSWEALEALVCVLVLADEARLYGVETGEARLLERVRAGRGGLWEELSRALRLGSSRRPSLVLALLGPPPLTRAALEGLGEPWRGRVLGLLEGLPAPEEAGFVSALLEALAAAAPLPPRALVDEVGWRVLGRGGEGVAQGARAVWEALGRGEAAGVVFVAGAALEGWACGECGASGPGAAPPACVSCGWEPAAAPARGMLEALAGARGVPVAEVDAEHPLAAALAVGALLAAAPEGEQEEP